jgi:thioredoxin-related protein
MTRNRIVPAGAFAVLVFSCLFSFVRAEDSLWQTDFEAAKTKAKTEKKLLLVDFTGSDWCIWCKRLKGEVFDLEAFKKEAPKQFVLVELDFPNDKSKITKEIEAQNAKLAKEYKIQGYPTILMLDVEGKMIAQTGYQPGGADKYLEHLGDLTKTWESLVKWKADLGKSKGLDRVKLLDQIVEACDKLNNPVDDLLAWSKEIVALDPDNKSGLKVKYEYRVPMIETDKLLEGQKVVEAVAVLRKAKEIEGLNDEQKNNIQGMLHRFEPIAEAMETYVKLQPDLEKAEGLDRAKLLDQLITAYSKLGMFAQGVKPAPNIGEWSKEIISLDPDNKAGLKNKYVFSQMLGDAGKLARDKKFDEGQEILDKALALTGITPEQVQEGQMAKGTNYLMRREVDKSLECLKKALDAAPQGPRAPILKYLIGNVEKQKEAAEKAKKDAEKKDEPKIEEDKKDDKK